MRYPDLVPAWVCTTPIEVHIESEGLSEEGEPAEAFTATLLCNWEDGGRAVLNSEQKFIEISGKAYFHGDICPDISNITAGWAIVFGETREIFKGFKHRNPDGTVNHTEIQFR